MVEVEIDSIRVSLMSQQRIVILKERNSARFLPIWIGPYEAEAITLSLQEVEVTRPLTHDLLRNILQELGAEITQVNITALRDDVFYARIILTINGREMSIDSRPSDAIALAVRAHVPVFIAEDVMDEAASIPEENIEGEPDERLDVFKDFVETLNLDDLETTEDDDKE
jgi:hypothetical protein